MSFLSPGVSSAFGLTLSLWFAPVAAYGQDVRFVQIDVSNLYACALSDAGEVYCWGTSSILFGTNDPIPLTRFAQGMEFQAVSVGGVTICGLDLDQRVWCWGELPGLTGAARLSRIPMPVGHSLRFESIATSPGQVCGIVVQGLGYCVGRDPYAGVTVGQPTQNPIEVKVRSNAPPIQFSRIKRITGFYWGLTSRGQSLFWRFSTRFTPAAADILGFDAGTIVAAVTDGFVASDRNGNLGIVHPQQTGSFTTFENGPYRIEVLADITALATTMHVAVNRDEVCALDTDGGVSCIFGGLVGRRPFNGQRTLFPNDRVIDLVSSSGATACALTENGGIYCWGRNRSGLIRTPAFGTIFPNPVRILP